MAGDVNWPGRGPTWLGVPALVVAVAGGLMLGEVTHRQEFSRELLTTGVEIVAGSVQVDVGRLLGSVSVGFRTADGREVRTELADHEYNDTEGMPDGVQTPAAGTRYAMPLKIVYRRSDPSVVLASVDARQWVDDRKTPRLGVGMLAGGLAVVLTALVMLSRDARKRGVAWWQWYTEGSRGPDTHKRSEK
ncbi:DUF3592 domain-containing protein [Kribbella sp. NPDC050281]|uniref:DUF3592 domain-containing protein n=1 Tax=Kribbella sp. NPDC050281 TaxID=3155515 RepID=UPI0033D676EA